jgi:hypothetical protein
MVTRCVPLLMAAIAVTLSARAVEPRPTFTVNASGVSILLPPAVLDDPAVRKQLFSGLTTTFRLAVRKPSDGSLSGARMEIRYDLWDEVWHVRRIDATGHAERARLASRDALEKWWRTPVRLFAPNESRVLLHIDLDVLPFSAAEEEDARQWIAKSGGVGTASSGSSFIDALIGTTLTAKPLTSFRWRIELAVTR